MNEDYNKDSIEFIDRPEHDLITMNHKDCIKEAVTSLNLQNEPMTKRQSINFIVNISIVYDIIHFIENINGKLTEVVCFNYQYIYECLYDYINYMCNSIDNLLESNIFFKQSDELFSISSYLAIEKRNHDSHVTKCANNFHKIIYLIFHLRKNSMDNPILSYIVYNCFYDKSRFVDEFKDFDKIKNEYWL